MKVKWSRYRPGVAQRVGRRIAILFNDSGTRRGWMVSSTPRPHFTPGKDPVPILQVAGWAPGPVWTGGKSRPHRDSIPDRPARSQSLYRLSYRAHNNERIGWIIVRGRRGRSAEICCRELFLRWTQMYHDTTGSTRPSVSINPTAQPWMLNVKSSGH